VRVRAAAGTRRAGERLTRPVVAAWADTLLGGADRGGRYPLGWSGRARVPDDGRGA